MLFDCHRMYCMQQGIQPADSALMVYGSHATWCVIVMCRSILSRTALVSDLSSKGVVNLVSNEVRQIYSLLEADFTPLELCQRLAPLLEKLETVSEPMSGMPAC